MPARLVVLALALGLLAPPARAEEKVIPATGPMAPDLAPFDALMAGFVADHDVPGAALAVAKDGRLVYARGFGYADRDEKTPVRPRSRFRIASLSKPITAAAVLKLVEAGTLSLDDRAFDVVKLAPPPGRPADPRVKSITVRQLLQHTAGWDSAASFDPMAHPLAIAAALGEPPPAGPEAIIRYQLGRPLDFDPGRRYAYSNFGYSVLGRVIEAASGRPYEKYVRDAVLAPLGLADTRLGRTLTPAPREVTYTEREPPWPAVVGPDLGWPVPRPYGAFYLEAMDAHGGWVSSAPDLVRFAAGLDGPGGLTAASRGVMFARPAGPAGHHKDGAPRDAYYGCGWQVRPAAGGAVTAWHHGALDGSAALLVRRPDGLCWAVLFNTRTDPRGDSLTVRIDPLLHAAAARVARWPAAALTAADLR